MIGDKMNDAFSEISDEIARLRAIEKDYNELYDLLKSEGWLHEDGGVSVQRQIIAALQSTYQWIKQLEEPF